MARGSRPALARGVDDIGGRERVEQADIVDLDISTSSVADHTVVHVGGEIDVYTAPALRERLDEEIQHGHYALVVDLSDVTFMDSTGLGVLVGRLKQIRLHDGTMLLVCAHDRVLKVFAITGLDKVFEIFPSIDEALAAAS